MKVLIVDDQFNDDDGMPLNTEVNLANFFEQQGFRVTYGVEWEGLWNSKEVLCYAPECGEDILTQFRELFCFSRYDPELVLLDIDLRNEKDGLDILVEIRKRDEEVPVLVMSAFHNIDSQRMGQLAYRAGREHANNFVSKAELARNPTCIFEHVKDSSDYRTDRIQQNLSNLINTKSGGYDLMECEKLGNISFFLQEDYCILEAVNTHFGEIARCGDEVRVLDIGCGTGRYEELLVRETPENVTVTGIDMASGMLRAARRKESLAMPLDCKRVVLDRGYAEYFNDATRYDFVIMGFGFLGYCDAPRVLRNVRENILKANGKVFVSFYQYDSPYYDIWAKQTEELIRLFHECLENDKTTEAEEIRSSIARIKAELPLATVISRDQFDLFVDADKPRQIKVVPMGNTGFERMIRASGFRLQDGIRQYLVSCCGYDHGFLQSVMHCHGQRANSMFDHLSAPYEKFYKLAHKDLCENERLDCLDLGLVERDYRIASKSRMPGYYCSALLEQP